MPLVRISLLKGRPAELRRKIGEAIHRALVETVGVPRDRCQILTEHGIARSDQIVIVQITLSVGRTLAQKRALFHHIADHLAALGVRREDAWVSLVEVAKENRSFAHLANEGDTSYAPADTETA